ncbi:tyrosine-protein phosphatase [Granulicella sibirica]|uniref:protein-tyrosine-phosphatase n=1 Tax=Granulicella sibirica TaxID=2479048 RepID=A0A4Q0T433_9BACT|nr:CpsB/CapC family capsule biosynthesis tyrosine phosphatase [Granulicella sibirica]RXH56306.1 Manganese-dependent protein-tyrosine phosphatase [Granulicella sibirica]
METSVAMAKMAAADGITHIACSPHANGKYSYDLARNEELANDLRGRLARAGVALTIGVGCDFHLSYDNIQAALADTKKYTINGHGYLLVELPDYGLPRGLTETFYQLRLAGMTPILTHPERNPTLQQEMDRIVDWLRGGLLVQVTTNSVTGGMGRKAERAAHDLLAKKWVHFLATDAHNTTSRPPKMSEARRMVEKKYGVEYAQALCVDNPLAVFEGRPLPEQDEAEDLYEDKKKDKGWVARLLGR